MKELDKDGTAQGRQEGPYARIYTFFPHIPLGRFEAYFRSTSGKAFLKKFETVLMGYSGAWGKPIHDPPRLFKK